MPPEFPPDALPEPRPAAPLIEPHRYASPAAAEAENDAVFRRAWHLLALADDLPGERDYVLRPVAGTELVIHRIDGRPIAYANVCPHRFSAFFTAASGNAPLRCSYHLWSFGADGYATGVPHRGDTPLSCYRQEGLRLALWQVGQVGRFLFASAEPRQTLAEFLGPLQDYFEEVSAGLGDELPGGFEQDIAADWKLVVQNTVEFDHVASVHATTYAQIMHKPLEMQAGAPHANAISYRIRLRDDLHAGRVGARIDAIYRRALYPYVGGYHQHMLFPATTVSILDNRHLAWIRYDPTGPGRCRASVRYLALKIPDLSPSERAMLDIVEPRDLAFSRQLIEEDRVACETAQRGVASHRRGMTGVLLPGESTVLAFQRMVQDWLAATAESPGTKTLTGRSNIGE